MSSGMVTSIVPPIVRECPPVPPEPTPTFGALPPASGNLVLVLPSTASGPPQTNAGANAELSVVP